MIIGQPSIMNLVDEIKMKNIILPMIQRPFVWFRDEERITKLFDSVIKKFPIGIILLYQKPHWSKIPIFGRNFLDKIDENTKFSEYDFEVKEGQVMVLDGHQRLQSFYLGVIDGQLNGKRLYHDLLFFKKRRPISDISFRFIKSDEKVIFDENEGSLYLRFAECLEIVKKISGVSPVKKEQEKKAIIEGLKRLIEPCKPLPDEDYRDIYDYLSQTISNSLFFKHDPHIFHYEVITDKEFDDEVLEIFVRFNQSGVPLTKSDLIFSTLKLQWKDIGNKIEDLGEQTGIDRDLLLKTLIVVSGLSANAKIQEVRENIDRLKNNYQEFEDVIQQFHDKVNKLTGLYVRFYKKYNFIIPVVYYFWKNRSKLKIEDLTMLPGVLRYMLIIVYNSNLRSDYHLNEIIKLIDKEETGEFPIKKIIAYLEKTGTKTAIDAFSLNTDPQLTFSLIQRNNWNPLNYKNKLHIDHIYPLAKKEELPEKMWELVDSIFNKYVVFAGDNIRKHAILPDEYFTGEREKLLDLYLLPKEHLRKEDFEKMIEWRKRKIKELFKEKLHLEDVQI